jgi:hypothetical protein
VSTPTPTSGGRWIDPRGHRFGAILSVVILSTAIVFGLPILVAFVALALFVSAWFGTRYSILGKPWPYVRKALKLGPPKELESEIPPRFAQALGSLGLGIAVVAFIVGLPVLGWLLTIAVAGLQAVLGLTGYCLGCKLYFLRWYAPGLFERFAR